MVERVIVAVIGAGVGGALAWYIKDHIKGERRESDKLDEFDKLLTGGDEWFSRGIVEVLESHDEQLENMSHKIKKAEEERENLKDRVERLKEKSKVRTDEMEEKEK